VARIVRGFQPAGQRSLDRAHVGAGIERTVRIAASASNMAPSLQPTAIPPPDSSMELTAVPIVYDEPIADLSACVCERLELQE